MTKNLELTDLEFEYVGKLVCEGIKRRKASGNIPSNLKKKFKCKRID